MKTSYGSAVPIYCSTSFDWIGKKGITEKSKLITLDTFHSVGEYEYKGVVLRSSKTGAEKYFDPVYDEDGYDGEFMVYSCGDISIQIWNY